MIFLDASHPANRGVLAALESSAWADRPLTPATEAIDPYYEAGCHPEVVGWMWERLAKKLPPESRCLVYGTPCLVQPSSGILVAAGMGTSYVLRILPQFVATAAELGSTPRHTWGNGDVTDLERSYGEGWVFGSYGKESVEWCRATFHHYGAAPASDAVLITTSTPGRQEAIPAGLVLMIGQEPHRFARVHTVAPDAARIEAVVRGLDWSRFKLVVLRIASDHFLEISGSLKPEDGLSGRYVEGDVEMMTRDAPSLDDAVRLLQGYAEGGSGWKSLVAWE